MNSLEEFVLSHNQNAGQDAPIARTHERRKRQDLFHHHKPITLYHCHHCGLSGSFWRKKHEAHMNEPKR